MTKRKTDTRKDPKSRKDLYCQRGHIMELTRQFCPNGDAFCHACKIMRFQNCKIFITNEEYKFFTELNNKCELCGQNNSSTRLHLDHNHKTNEFRGWLCHYCNTAIGLLNEDTELMKKAINYIENNGFAYSVKRKAKK